MVIKCSTDDRKMVSCLFIPSIPLLSGYPKPNIINYHHPFRWSRTRTFKKTKTTFANIQTRTHTYKRFGFFLFLFFSPISKHVVLSIVLKSRTSNVKTLKYKQIAKNYYVINRIVGHLICVIFSFSSRFSSICVDVNNFVTFANIAIRWP